MAEGGAPHWRLDIAEASRLVRERALLPSELVAAVLDRLATTEPAVRAYVALDADRALAAAHGLDRELERGSWRGPLHGIPLAVKDVVDVAGLPTRCGSHAFDDAPPPSADATVVMRLREAGAVVVGKTTTSELAAGSDSPPTRNPWDPARSPGGSSGGSAAAVAACSALGAIGTDTLGSIRLPAALCGVVGMKPTYGLVPRPGVRTGTDSLDHVGPLARSVEDATLLLAAMAPDRVAAGDAEGPPRVGLVRGVFLDDADDAVARAVDRAADALAGVAAVREVAFPDLDGALEAGFTLAGRELASYLGWPAMPGADRVGERMRGRLDAAVARPGSELVAARRRRSVLAADVRSLFRRERLDAILTAAVPIVAPRHGESVLVRGGRERSVHILLTRGLAPFDLTGQPAVTIPAGLSDEGLPIAVQLVGRRGADRALLGLARALEDRLPRIGLPRDATPV